MSYIKKMFPGLACLLVLSYASQYLSSLIVVVGKNPLEATSIAVIFGLIIRNYFNLPAVCLPGIALYEKMLVWGIVLLGASLSFQQIFANGWAVLLIIAVTMSLGLSILIWLGQKYGLSQTLTILLAAGTTICGGSAIAIIGPIIDAKREEVSYAITTVSLFGLLAILTYPYLGAFFNVSDMQFGVFAGVAIHSTPQVVAAGFIFSEVAGKTATAIKLIRNCFIAPIAFLIAGWQRRTLASAQTNNSLKKAFPWFLFGFFLMAACNSWDLLPNGTASQIANLGKSLILISMAGIGLSTNLKDLKAIGFRPLFIGMAGTIIVALVASILIKGLVA